MRIGIYQPQTIYELGQRTNQEDSISPAAGRAGKDTRIFVLCDGMGGHAKGEVASAAVCKGVTEYLETHLNADAPLSDNDILAALSNAYTLLDKLDDGAAKKMGCTLTLLCLHRGGATMAHIGDSRIYHLRPAEGKVLYKSRDHSLVFDLYQAGELTYEEMRHSSQKNIITRALMPGEDNRVRPDIVHTTDIQPGDYFYLCSDGMLEQMEDDELLKILGAPVSDEQKAKQLIAATKNNRDNHSAFLVQVEAVAGEALDAAQPNDAATAHCNALRIVPAAPLKAEQEAVAIVSDEDLQKHFNQMPAPPKKKKSAMPTLMLLCLIAAAVLAGAAYFLFGGVPSSQKEIQPGQEEQAVADTTEAIMEKTEEEKMLDSIAIHDAEEVMLPADTTAEAGEETGKLPEVKLLPPAGKDKQDNAKKAAGNP